MESKKQTTDSANPGTKLTKTGEYIPANTLKPPAGGDKAPPKKKG